MAKSPEIFICSEDAAALARLLDHRSAETAFLADARHELAEKLVDAHIVPLLELPGGTVRLDSRVVYEELPSGPRRQIVIVAPLEADAAARRVSVLSPIGLALLGYAAGSVVEVRLPVARSLFVRIVKVGAQEQASEAERAHA